MIGLLVAGPWVTMVGSRLWSAGPDGPSTLIAGRRLADSPRAAFRAVSGLIVALFIASAALGMISTILAYHSTSTGGAAGRNILIEDLGGDGPAVDGGQPPAGVEVPASLLSNLGAIRGVHGVAEIHFDPPRSVPGSALRWASSPVTSLRASPRSVAAPQVRPSRRSR